MKVRAPPYARSETAAIEMKVIFADDMMFYTRVDPLLFRRFYS